LKSQIIRFKTGNSLKRSKNTSMEYQPRYYATACVEKPESYYDYPNFEITWSSMEPYEVIHKLGRGKYSEVYDGINNVNN